MHETHNSRRRHLLAALCASALAAAASGRASAAAPAVDEAALLAAGFKVLVVASPVQRDWMRDLPPGKMRPLQRNGKTFFVYPDAAKDRIFIGGPQENDTYARLHPESQPKSSEAAISAYRGKQDAAMRKDTARDESNPFLGASWFDLGW